MRKLLLSIAAVSCAVLAGAQASLSRLLPDAAAKELSEKRTVTRIIREGDLPSLIPHVESAAGLSSQAGSFKAAIGAEVLRIMPSTAGAGGRPPALSHVLNILASVSTMKGTTYWSVTHKDRRVLFTESYAVESADRAIRIPDPVFPSLPGRAEVFSFQEDTTFGKNVYRSLFVTGQDHIWARTENAQAIAFLFIPVLPAGCFVTHSIVVPTAEGTLYYGAALLRPSVWIGNADTRAESLINRLTAAADWLESRLAGP